jgi:hypothetical protein
MSERVSRELDSTTAIKPNVKIAARMGHLPKKTLASHVPIATGRLSDALQER